MGKRHVYQRAAQAALVTATIGGVLLGPVAAASASPVPGIPLTTAKLCTEGKGTVGPGPAGSQLCNGGGDGGDVIISQPAADALVQTEPHPAKPRPNAPAPPAPAARPAPPAPPAPAAPPAPPPPPHK